MYLRELKIINNMFFSNSFPGIGDIIFVYLIIMSGVNILRKGRNSSGTLFFEV